jgi:hypothetical protein
MFFWLAVLVAVALDMVASSWKIYVFNQLDTGEVYVMSRSYSSSVCLSIQGYMPSTTPETSLRMLEPYFVVIARGLFLAMGTDQRALDKTPLALP